MLFRSQQLFTGTTIKHLPSSVLAEIRIWLPDKEKQGKIADYLDSFADTCNNLSSGLPAEIAARQKQYEYYRDKLLSFPEKG